ncbi:hypothetical protein NLU13_4600 [Sarocladium strictum]|uniref:Uncharacterized protein n=1 Tax=Sarocladium strictum TaxID=5046 RepID=A0AA39L8Z2_SARSR|nr:hypothetical protein NLU13_4600 [Sarocladium strictum]
MATRRASFTCPSLKIIGRVSQKLPANRPQWTVHTRAFATVADGPWSPQLRKLLSAIQTRDLPAISTNFAQWTDALIPNTPEFDEAVADEIILLPHSTISEIIRNLDPIANPDLDHTHGLRISLGQTQYVDATDLADEFGMRPRDRLVFRGMQNLLVAKGCPAEEDGLSTPDMETILRCAGVVADTNAIHDLFGQAPRLRGFAGRTSRTIHEYLKAFYAVEPAYHQFDAARIMRTGRDLIKDVHDAKWQDLLSMDSIRYSRSALLREPWDRDQSNIARRRARLLGLRGGKSGFTWQWSRWHADGIKLDEEFICTAIICFSRSWSLKDILKKFYEARYGLLVSPPSNKAGPEITGGFRFPPGHPLRPTERLLHATVDALGSMGHISLSLNLVDHLSRLHEIPITHELWSKVLKWTLINSSKPYAQLRAKLGNRYWHLGSTADHVPEVISMMTSEPFNIVLNFEDNVILAKTLITQKELFKALDVIRQKLVPQYEVYLQDYRNAVMDEVLRKDAAPSSPLSNSYDRQRAGALLDQTWHRIQHLIHRVIRRSAYDIRQSIRRNFVPNLVREFRPFVSKAIQYRTENGLVTLLRSDNEPGASRNSFAILDREMLPTMRSRWETERLRNATREPSSEEEALASHDAASPLLDLGDWELENGVMPEAYEEISNESQVVTEVVGEEGDVHSQPGTEDPDVADEDEPMIALWTERRVIRQATWIPAKREKDLSMPSMQASEEERVAWRHRVFRELTL